MKGGIDAVELDRCILKSRARAQRTAQDRRARDDIGELTADPHDFVCVSDSLEILAMRHVRIRSFRRHDGVELTRLEPRANDQRAFAPECRIDEVFRETLRLGLPAITKPYP